MNLYLLTQNTNTGYDTFDSAVVCAPDAETARAVEVGDPFWTWTTPDEVKALFIGVADPSVLPGIVLRSFNAG